MRPNGKVNGASGYSPAPRILDSMIRSSDRDVKMREYQRDANRRFRNRTRTIPPGIDDATAWVQAEKAIENAQDIEDSALRWEIVDSACSLQERLTAVAKLKRSIATAHEAANKARALSAMPERGKAEIRALLRTLDRQIAASASIFGELAPDERSEYQNRIQEARGTLAAAFQALR